MSTHQTMSGYDGTLAGRPRYNGIEYDWEVPDNLVVGSPGGVSTIHHHYTKGFDGRGNTSSDIYAGQGNRYISGEFGSLYQSGHTASQQLGYYPSAPDYQYWQNQEPQQYSYSQSTSNMWAPLMTLYHQPGAYQSSPKSENFEYPSEGNEDFELLDQADVSPAQRLENIDSQLDTIESNQQQFHSRANEVIVIPEISPWLLFLLFLFAFIVFSFWSEAGHLFISQRFHNGKKPSWQKALLYAVGITALFALVIWMAGIPITTFESI